MLLLLMMMMMDDDEGCLMMVLVKVMAMAMVMVTPADDGDGDGDGDDGDGDGDDGDGHGDGDDSGHCRLKQFLGQGVAPQPLARFASWSAPIVGSGRTDTVGFPIGSQTRTLGGDTVTWIPRTPDERCIGSGSADLTASSTRYGMLRSNWRWQPGPLEKPR